MYDLLLEIMKTIITNSNILYSVCVYTFLNWLTINKQNKN